MKICPKCNSEYEDDVKFCKKDGTLLVAKVEKVAEGKKCPQCGKLYPEDDGFCSVCGVKLLSISETNRCPECGAELSEGAKFCSKCGTAVTGKNDNTTSKELPHDMVYVEGGSLWLGDNSENDDDEDDNDNPRHMVTLDSFYISKYLVTQQLWNSVMSYDKSEYIGKNRPVDNVSWYDAVVFCNELSKKDGLTPCYKIDKSHEDPNNESDCDALKWTVKCNFMANGYRLPTEAEWEYAARGGQESRGYKYAGSNEPDHVAWYGDNSDNETHNVGEKNCNELGLYDMSGNVWEWCWDWNDDEINGGRNPTGPSSGSYRCLRGGAWLYRAYSCAVSGRGGSNPYNRYYYFGLRLVRSSS